MIAVLPLDVPVDLGREEAQRLAAQELADPAYHLHDPGLTERALRWAVERVQDLIDTTAGVLPGGVWSLVLVVAAGIAVGGFALWRNGPIRRTATRETALFVGKTRSAADHRRAADKAAASGRWEVAVLERYRAIVRSLEERTVLEPRPGRTADEAAAEAGRGLPLLAADLIDASTTFDAVVYGGRPATSTDDRFLRELDRAASATSVRAYAAGPRL